MNDFALVGHKKHGCLIDNHKQVIIYYDHLSLYEKLKKKDSEIKIKYSDIEFIKYVMAFLRVFVLILLK